MEIELEDKRKTKSTKPKLTLPKPIRANKMKAKKFTEFVESEGTNNENIKEKLIISNMENLYLSIKKESIIFKRIRLQMFLIFFVNSTFLWLFFGIANSIKNNYYCYNYNSNSFEICNIDTVCDNLLEGVSNSLYLTEINGVTLYNKSALEELNLVNKIFGNYFLKEALYYNKHNSNKINRTKEMIDLYNTIIVVTKNENWHLLITFKQHCNRQTNLGLFTLFFLIGLIIGNIVFCFLADLFGRKKVLSLLLLIQLVGCLGIFLYTHFILTSGDNNSIIRKSQGLLQSEDLDLNTTNTNDTLGENFFNFDTIPSLDKFHSNNLKNFTEAILSTQIIQENYHNTKLFLGIFFMFISLGMSSGHSISLSLLIETSCNDTILYSSYLFFYLGMVLSYFFQFILTTATDSFHIPYLILSVMFLYSFITITFFCYESPRHQFEFYQYEEITRTFLQLKMENNLQGLMININNPKVKAEVDRMNLLKKENLCLFDKVCFSGFNQKIRKLKRELIKRETCDLSRTDIIVNPLILYFLIKHNKNLKNSSLIVLSLIANISLLYFLIINNFNMPYIISRENYYENCFFNLTPFYLTITTLISNFFFYFLLKFFGVKIILFLGFFMTFVLSLIYTLGYVKVRDPEDLNEYYLNDMALLSTSSQAFFTSILTIMVFFTHGLYFCLFFYLIKFTKTVYRCLFFGGCHIVVDCMMLISCAIVQYFEKNMYYVTLVSIIGFVNSFFIDGEMGYNLVTDFRKVEYG